MNGDPRTASYNLLPIQKYRIMVKDFIGSPLRTISALHRFFRQIWAILCELKSSHSHIDMQIVSQGQCPRFWVFQGSSLRMVSILPSI